MTILIKGMEVPQNCCECGVEWCERWKGLIIAGMSIAKARPTDCPIIEVPTPHGRLKDVDKLEVHDGWLSEAEGYSTHITFVYSNAIDLAPTVIEAEK